MRQLLSSGGAAWIAGSLDTQDGATRLVPGNDEIQNRSRGALVRPSFANHDDAKKDSLPSSKREAERRKAHAIHVRVCADKCARTCATYPLRGCAPTTPPSPACGGGSGKGAPAFRRSRLRHSPSATTPMAQPQNRVSRRLKLAGVLPACLQPSVKHAPCRPVLVPADRGPRAARVRIGNSARGHRPSLRFSGMPSGKAPSVSEMAVCN